MMWCGLSPPGFGAPLPDTFEATFLAYRDWLVEELEGIDQPVDLVGHDWGGCHVVNAVMHRPDLMRSWVSDTVGLFDTDYVWHDMGQLFQTPEVGEQAVEMMLAGSVEDRSQRMADFGLPPDVARSLVQRKIRRWVEAILRLYRSACQPAWPTPDAHWKTLRPGQDCRYWPPTTPSSARTRSGIGRPTEPAP